MLSQAEDALGMLKPLGGQSALVPLLAAERSLRVGDAVLLAEALDV